MGRLEGAEVVEFAGLDALDPGSHLGAGKEHGTSLGVVAVADGDPAIRQLTDDALMGMAVYGPCGVDIEQFTKVGESSVMTRVLLLHGWDWEKYPVFKPKDQWQNRQKLVAELQERYDVSYPSLPGFSCDDANRRGSWTLDDYTNWLQGEITKGCYIAVIGYSFGCAVATHWQYLYRNPSVSLVLLSPAITRAYGKPPNKALAALANILKILQMNWTVHFLRRLYLTRVAKNPHVIHGTPFLQATYSNIVSVDLSGELAQSIDAGFPITCVFGGADTATPPETLFSRTPAARSLSLVIPGGTHDIGETHPEEIVRHIVDFLNPLKVQG